MKKVFVILAGLTLLGAVPLSARRAATHPKPMSPPEAAISPHNAVAELHPASGSQVTGTVTFTQEGNRVTIVADVQGLLPNTSHGFHIHERGDCSAPDAMSAGGHFNPEHHPHAGPNTAMRHAGDLGNLEANANGRAYKRMTVDNITLGPGPTNVIGRGVIVHEKLDDYTTQPTGNAGARIACGQIVAPSGSAATAAIKRVSLD
jgi:Cu-Zn family superoxide dismutase